MNVGTNVQDFTVWGSKYKLYFTLVVQKAHTDLIMYSEGTDVDVLWSSEV